MKKILTWVGALTILAIVYAVGYTQGHDAAVHQLLDPITEQITGGL